MECIVRQSNRREKKENSFYRFLIGSLVD